MSKTENEGYRYERMEGPHAALRRVPMKILFNDEERKDKRESLAEAWGGKFRDQIL